MTEYTVDPRGEQRRTYRAGSEATAGSRAVNVDPSPYTLE